MSDLISTYFQQANLAQAAYAALTLGMSRAQFINVLKDKGMATTQATAFADTYEIIEQHSDPSGFSGTLFKNRQTGEYTFAIRGTEFNAVENIITDIVFADIAGIVVNGWAQAQIDAMNAYYDSLTTPVAQGGLEKLDPNAAINVTGHSLGGHLTTVFALHHPSNVAHAYTYNGAGTGDGLDGALEVQLAEILGIESSLPNINNQITNLYAYPGLELTSGVGVLWGETIPTYIEDQGRLFGDLLVGNHGVRHLSDALAVISVFGALDENAEIAQINGILEAASIKESQSLESLTEALYILFENPYPAGFVGPRPQIDRETMYQYIQTLQANQNYQLAAQTGSVASLVGLGTSNLIAAAQNDMGVMYALQHLNPFAITGSTVIYEQHNTEGELDAANYSEEYLEDRAGFLIASMELALGNEGGPRFYYTDAITGETLLSGFLSPPANYDPQSVRQIRFGGTGSDNLTGGTLEDHLYGGDGEDILIGGEGNDYLEGGNGRDYYLAEGNDIIFDQDGDGWVTLLVLSGVTTGSEIEKLKIN